MAPASQGRKGGKGGNGAGSPPIANKGDPELLGKVRLSHGLQNLRGLGRAIVPPKSRRRGYSPEGGCEEEEGGEGIGKKGHCTM